MNKLAKKVLHSCKRKALKRCLNKEKCVEYFDELIEKKFYRMLDEHPDMEDDIEEALNVKLVFGFDGRPFLEKT